MDGGIPVSVETPTRSRLKNLANPLSLGPSLGTCSLGMRSQPIEAMGTVNSVRNQNVQCQDAYWMKIAPTKRPRTGKKIC